MQDDDRRQGELRISTLVLAAVMIFNASFVSAHGTTTPGKTPKTVINTAVTDTDGAFPVQYGGPFSLVNQDGLMVTDKDYLGKYLLVFFGYANCRGMCPLGLRRMTEALDLIPSGAEDIQPLLITIDPQNDTPQAMKAHLPTIHPLLVGLTGSEKALVAARKSYKVDVKPVEGDFKDAQVYSHGTLIYLMGPDGKFRTLLPPFMDPQTMAGIIQKYLK